MINPEHLFEQAERLIAPSPTGRPRQADLRRAISAAYYGVFHATLTAAADEFVGRTKRSTSLYSLVYRSVDHKALRDVCSEVSKKPLSARYARHEPHNGFGSNMRAFAVAVLELQGKRHAADYDPLFRVKTSDAFLIVGTARSALRQFQQAEPFRRKAFLALLLLQPR